MVLKKNNEMKMKYFSAAHIVTKSNVLNNVLL